MVVILFFDGGLVESANGLTLRNALSRRQVGREKADARFPGTGPPHSTRCSSVTTFCVLESVIGLWAVQFQSGLALAGVALIHVSKLAKTADATSREQGNPARSTR